jgi:hypothetical protein
MKSIYMSHEGIQVPQPQYKLSDKFIYLFCYPINVGKKYNNTQSARRLIYLLKFGKIAYSDLKQNC